MDGFVCVDCENEARLGVCKTMSYECIRYLHIALIDKISMYYISGLLYTKSCYINKKILSIDLKRKQGWPLDTANMKSTW